MATKLFSAIALATVSFQTGSTTSPALPDTKGKMPIRLNYIAGKAISYKGATASVISGTVAESQNFIPGNTHLVKIQELPLDLSILRKDGTPVGRRFEITNILKVTNSIELLDLTSKLGDLVAEDVSGIPTVKILGATAPEKVNSVYENPELIKAPATV